MIVQNFNDTLGSTDYSSHYDSELRTEMMNASTNAELTLVLKVCLQQAVGISGRVVDANHKPWDTVPWSPVVWSKFLDKYSSEATKYWDGKFWLVTPKDNTDLCWPKVKPTHRCNVWCRFRLDTVNSPSQAHKTIQVANVAPMEVQETHYQECRAYAFRSNAAVYKAEDLEMVARDQRNSSVISVEGHRIYKQRTFIHEVGHALGLPHIAVMTKNAKCPVTDTNATACYGTTLRESMDIMGEGEDLSAYDAQPWLDRINKHFQQSVPDRAAPANPAATGKFEAVQHRAFPVRLAS
jgi:hypothetical protein